MKPGAIQCFGCGAWVENLAGLPHAYIGASQGCWDKYGQILAMQYGEYNYPDLTHRITVDAYAIQHPGQPGRQSIQSVNTHLVSLYFVFIKKASSKEATQKMRDLLAKEPAFEWLAPPDPNGHKTVLDVLTATNQYEHENMVRAWAEDVWNSWYVKHGMTIEKLVYDHLLFKPYNKT